MPLKDLAVLMLRPDAVIRDYRYPIKTNQGIVATNIGYIGLKRLSLRSLASPDLPIPTTGWTVHTHDDKSWSARPRTDSRNLTPSLFQSTYTKYRMSAPAPSKAVAEAQKAGAPTVDLSTVSISLACKLTTADLPSLTSYQMYQTFGQKL
ncbi:hypothetical protein AG1IA_04677 [Rhizoctonia solani AG-1 IA]|uniref:Uncharacterized protein n=1 Tax=Thanatephorus cucumeris (strain AG1-IA) TaxID=983506 RepID=L8WY81_THACA|nr:hypothetical protein AG1IA_04677 [Rhizoctonia solani AG-1 IA]